MDNFSILRRTAGQMRKLHHWAHGDAGVGGVQDLWKAESTEPEDWGWPRVSPTQGVWGGKIYRVQ